MHIQPLEGRVILTDYEQPIFTKAPSEAPTIFRELANYWRNPYGDPRFRLSWGEQAVKTRGGQRILAYRKKNPKQIQTGWMQGNTRYPNNVDITTLPRLPVLQPIVVTQWEGYPFWILEEWESPEVLAAEWSPRYLYIDRLGKTVDWMGPVPERGCYRAVAFIHDGNFGYVPLPERLANLLKGLVTKAEEDVLENPYVENTPDLIEKRKQKLDQELDAQEAAAKDQFADRLIAEVKRPKFLEDLNTAMYSEVDFHLRRQAEKQRMRS